MRYHSQSIRINTPCLLSVFVLFCMHIGLTLAEPANKSFDIVYINLARHTAKKEHVEQMLKHANCTFKRFNGVDGKELHKGTKSIKDYTGGIAIEPTDESVYPRLDSNNPGRAGCHLSHLIVLRSIDISGSKRPVLILEDDIDLDVGFVEKVEEALANPELNSMWNVIMLGGLFDKSWWGRPCKNLVEGKYLACLHAYLVNGAESAKRIADAIDTPKCPGRPVDLIIEQQFRNDPSFTIYCFSPMIAVQRRDLFESSISIPANPSFARQFLKDLFAAECFRPLSSSLAKASSHAKPEGS
ncbi:hypothetical protein NEDG_01576 [Nematocida displodere]|uniref:Glycosyl transferase family 25 domain-containing protein n=1 Tax=Nematocida displodere TaxID=1805483 RepID=A0A177EGS2_9MICR|nr:hypothetical protein NEDG_01576 [Nematocida displodere]